MKRPPSALHFVDKPPGVTSAALVDGFRRAHAGPWPLKVSHGGVLDPFAHGLVVLLVGAANRLFEALHEAPKRYVATLQLGVETDTGDGDGRVSTRSTTEDVTDARIDEALTHFVGWTQQTPPTTSNKRVDGERAYVRAHRGEHFELPAQRVYCHAARRVPGEALRVELLVRGGFYVRSLAVDLGRRLGCGAHLTALHRTHLGPWTVETPPQTGRAVLPWLPWLALSDAELGALRAGAGLPARTPTQPDWPFPAGFPPPTFGPRAFHQGRLVALGTTLLPGGI